MISPKSLVQLGLNVETGCPHTWRVSAWRHRGLDCAATKQAHMCVGNAEHRGKHMCPCGQSQWTVEPTGVLGEHIHATVRSPDGKLHSTCTCSGDFARTAALGVVSFETLALP